MRLAVGVDLLDRVCVAVGVDLLTDWTVTVCGCQHQFLSFFILLLGKRRKPVCRFRGVIHCFDFEELDIGLTLVSSHAMLALLEAACRTQQARVVAAAVVRCISISLLAE